MGEFHYSDTDLLRHSFSFCAPPLLLKLSKHSYKSSTQFCLWHNWFFSPFPAECRVCRRSDSLTRLGEKEKCLQYILYANLFLGGHCLNFCNTLRSLLYFCFFFITGLFGWLCFRDFKQQFTKSTVHISKIIIYYFYYYLKWCDYFSSAVWQNKVTIWQISSMPGHNAPSLIVHTFTREEILAQTENRCAFRSTTVVSPLPYRGSGQPELFVYRIIC